MPLNIAALNNTVFKVGGYHHGGGAGPGLGLHTQGGVSFDDPGHVVTPYQMHFKTQNGLVQYTLTTPPTEPGNVRLISFSPPDPGGVRNCYYLPFKGNNITSIEIGNAARRFVTDNLSGCSIFIDRRANGNLVIHHANLQGGNYMPTAEQAQDMTYERYGTIAVKDQLHANAVAESYAGAAPQGSLFKSRYNSAAAGASRAAAFGGAGYSAGTTVVGFRDAGGWQFYYQTWGGEQQGAGYACRVVAVERFFP